MAERISVLEHNHEALTRYIEAMDRGVERPRPVAS
jgi:hypothetical protein